MAVQGSVVSGRADAPPTTELSTDGHVGYVGGPAPRRHLSLAG